MFNSNCASSSKSNSNDKEGLKKCLKKFQLQNKNKAQINNNNYTNPFFKSNNFTKDNDESKEIKLLKQDKYDSIDNSSNYSNHQDGFINEDTNYKSNQKILENSENSYCADDNKYNNSNVKYINLYDKNKKEINNDNYELMETNDGGNKCKYLLIGFLGTYSTFIFLYKNEKFRKMLKSKFDKINLNALLDYIKLFIDKIKSFRYLSGLKELLNNGIDYLIKLFDGFNDRLRLMSIFIIFIFSWYIFKLIVNLVFKCRNKNDIEENKEDNNEMFN
jgi:hypothetical protein